MNKPSVIFIDEIDALATRYGFVWVCLYFCDNDNNFMKESYAQFFSGCLNSKAFKLKLYVNHTITQLEKMLLKFGPSTMDSGEMVCWNS